MVVKKNTDFWVGTEVEGRFKGIKTLFVKGDKLKEEIEKKVVDNKVFHIYFGAGGQSRIWDFENILYFANKGLLISYEFHNIDLSVIPEEILQHKNIHIIVTFKSNYIYLLKDTDSIKVEDYKNVYMNSKCNMYETKKSKDYKGDIFV